MKHLISALGHSYFFTDLNRLRELIKSIEKIYMHNLWFLPAADLQYNDWTFWPKQTPNLDINYVKMYPDSIFSFLKYQLKKKRIMFYSVFTLEHWKLNFMQMSN